MIERDLALNHVFNKFGADNGTRTHEVCLEGRNVTTTSYPHNIS